MKSFLLTAVFFASIAHAAPVDIIQPAFLAGGCERNGLLKYDYPVYTVTYQVFQNRQDIFNAPWSNPKSFQVELKASPCGNYPGYTQLENLLPVSIDPGATSGFLAYTIKSQHMITNTIIGDTQPYENYHETQTSNIIVLNLSQSSQGQIYSLPFTAWTGYMHSSNIQVYDAANPSQQRVSYQGVIKKVFVGFTTASADQYRQNNDVLWMDDTGSAGTQEVIDVNYRDTSSDKPESTTIDALVWVPVGKNIVFKLAIKNGSGQDAETKTYFATMNDK